MKKKFGFTLAEVLITLTIIGVVAAITIPNMVNSTATQENISAYKKMIAMINQAITMQYSLEGTNMRDITFVTREGALDENEETRHLTLGNMFKNRFQVARTIESRDQTNGHTNVEEGAGNIAFILSDGTVIEIPNEMERRPSCIKDENLTLTPDISGGFKDAANSDCLYSILIDVNGGKGSCVINREEAPEEDALPKQLAVTGCFWLNVYPTEVKPADWTGRMLLYNNGKPKSED